MDTIRSIIPGVNIEPVDVRIHVVSRSSSYVHVYTHADVALSSDFIAGFCGETEEEHCDTISLLDTVKFDMTYMFAYCMRKVGSN